jgi:N-methylhydantoinase A
MAESEAVEIVNFQVTAVGAIPKPHFSSTATRDGLQPPIPHETRTAYFNSTDAIQVPVFRRSGLAAGAVIDGPAVIEEKTSTTVLYPGQRAEIDGYLNVAVASAADA